MWIGPAAGFVNERIRPDEGSGGLALEDCGLVEFSLDRPGSWGVVLCCAVLCVMMYGILAANVVVASQA